MEICQNHRREEISRFRDAVVKEQEEYLHAVGVAMESADFNNIIICIIQKGLIVMANKRINPRHIVVDKRNVNLDAIVDEAMKDDMHRAWLLIGKVLKEQEQLGLEEIKELRNSIKEINASEGNIRYAERLMGRKERPHVSLDDVSTAADLKKLKANMEKLALHTALCSICLGLHENRFSEERLRRIFRAVDEVQAKIENGEESYEELERQFGEE